MTQEPVSLRPSDMGAGGGGPPLDSNLLVVGAKAMIFDYQGGTTPATGAMVGFKDDDGNEYSQFYSAGDPVRIIPNAEGTSFTAAKPGDKIAIVESSNLGVLFKEMVNAGFDENRITPNVDCIVGLYAYWQGKAISRTGMRGQGSTAPRPIAVPTKILKLPWEQGGTGAVGGAVGGASDGVNMGLSTADLAKEARALVDAALLDTNPTTRRAVTGKAFALLGAKPQDEKEAITNYLYSPEFATALQAQGYVLEGESIRH